MSLLSAYNLTQNQAFRDRVTMAVWIAATKVQGEAETGSQPFHSKRNALAAEVFSGSKERAFLFAVVTNPTIGAASENNTPIHDADIEFVVESVWNDLAGVTQDDL